LRRLSSAILVALLLGLSLAALPVRAASTPKVVVVVGPVGDHNAHYKSDARDIADEARRHTSNVVTIFTPKATWPAVKAAAQGASVFVYLGHGNGWPSIYPPFQTITKDGLGLDPQTGADGDKHVYYGEDYIRNNIRFAPNAVVLLYHLCYASGNTEPGLSQGTFAEARERVDNYGAGFIGAGARAVLAEGHPAHPATNTMRQLFTTNRTLDQVFRSAPTWHGHLHGPYESQRTPGLRFQLDADTAAPSGFYRSIVGDLGLRASAVTGALPTPTDGRPAAFVVPGAAEVVAADGVGLFGSLAKAQDPSATAATTVARATRLRLTAEEAPAGDGTRVFAATDLGTSAAGYVRATGLAPRDSAPTLAWTLDRSAGLLSPNGDGERDRLVVAARFSERIEATLTVRNAGGTAVWSQTLDDDIARFAWDLRNDAGEVVKDGAYTWTLRGHDDWGNAGITVSGGFTLDATPPTSTATASSTEGLDGWRVSPVELGITAKDALSGVRSISYRIDDGSAKTYDGGVTVTANGRTTVEYRATDKAGIREAWHQLSFRIDTRPPSIGVGLTGTAGDAGGTWRSAVTLKPTFTDAISGMAGRLVSIDGGPATALSGGSVVVEPDGAHVVTFTGIDAAGNQATASRSFVIDTAPPVVTPGDSGSRPPTVTPNGDKVTESISLPFAVSEASTVTARIAGPGGATVRTLSAAGTAGRIAWDGRTATGKPVPDGRYTVALTGRDVAGNVGEPATLEVDVYAALASLTRTPTLFYPQDGDALARKSTIAFRLLAPATVTVRVLDANGDVVRTAYADRALPAGAASWAWNGQVAGGAFAKPGIYRIAVSATNGIQRAGQSTSVEAAAFHLSPSVESAVRGRGFTLTARSAEPLATTPVVVVNEAGVRAWTVTMTRASTTTWTALITPKRGGDPGTLGLTVRARDRAGGRNASSLRLDLR
jgi:flagellar hook assembly protein FlgD